MIIDIDMFLVGNFWCFIGYGSYFPKLLPVQGKELEAPCGMNVPRFTEAHRINCSQNSVGSKKMVNPVDWSRQWKDNSQARFV